MIQQAGSHFNEALIKSNGKAVEEARDKPGLLVDKDTAQIINLMSVRSNPKLKLKIGNLDIGEFEMNSVKLIYQENAFIVKDNIYELSDQFINFLTHPNIKHGEIEENENKVKRFLKDIRYDLGKGDKKSARYRTIKRIIAVKDDVYGRGLNSNPDPNNLIERLELLILETKAGHDGLYDEIFIERFNRTLLHIINEPMFINGDGNWVIILNDAVITYNNNIHSTINMTPDDASYNPDKVKNTLSFKNITPKLKFGVMLEMQINVISSLRDTLLIGIESCLKLMKF